MTNPDGKLLVLSMIEKKITTTNNDFAKKRVQWLNDPDSYRDSTSHKNLWYVDNLVLRDSLLNFNPLSDGGRLFYFADYFVIKISKARGLITQLPI